MKKRTNINPARTCTCGLCGTVAVSIPGTRHRHCGGKPDAPRLTGRAWATTAARLAPDLDAGSLWQARLYSINVSPDHEDRPGAVLEILPAERDQQQ